MPRKSRKPMAAIVEPLEMIRPHAAGIDIGATSHWVALPPSHGKEAVKEFEAFTNGLIGMRDWLLHHGITTVAMESTGVYWTNPYEILEEAGIEVYLVDPRKIKQVPSRKSDVLDCQWIQQLHAYGLLNKAHRPDESTLGLRTLTRLRTIFIKDQSREIQHMQKALTEMNLKLQHVVSDIMGVTGLKIIDDIIEGKRDPASLAKHRDRRCEASEELIQKALEGHYRQEQILALTLARERIKHIDSQMTKVDLAIKEILEGAKPRTDIAPHDNNEKSKKPKTPPRPGKNGLKFDAQDLLISMTGIDLTTIPGLNAPSALALVAETGTDMKKWKTSAHFASWANLAPGINKSGGVIKSSKMRSSSSNVANILRMAAFSQINAKSPFGDWIRIKKAHLGVQKALVAGAHKIARIYYAMMTKGGSYDPTKPFVDEETKREREMNYIRRRAERLGCTVVKVEPEPT